MLDQYVVRTVELVVHHDGLAVYRVEDEEEQTRYLLKLAFPTEDPEEYGRWAEALQHEAEVLRHLASANLSDRQAVPLISTLSEATIVLDDVEHAFPVALLTQAPQGESLAHLLQKRGALGEHIALRIGYQVAQVLLIAHQEHVLCGEITPARIFWDSINQHATVGDWYLAQRRDGASPSARHTEQMRSEFRALARFIAHIASGQPQADQGLATSRLSVPCASLLERLANTPSDASSELLVRLAQEPARLLKYWDISDLFAHTEQYIATTLDRGGNLDLRTLHSLSENIEIGKVKEPGRPWPTLLESSAKLLGQPLDHIRNEIVNGNFRQALLHVRPLATWPTIHHQALWRQRLAEIGLADERLATDQAFSHHRKNMGHAIEAWDNGNYTIPEWLQQLGSLFNQVMLTPAAQAVIQRLGYELRVADLAERFDNIGDSDIRLTLIGELDKLILPDGVDSHLAERWRQIRAHRPQLLEQQQSRQQQTIFANAFQPLEQRITAHDTSITPADFEQVLQQAHTQENQQRVHLAQAHWLEQRISQRDTTLSNADFEQPLRQMLLPESRQKFLDLQSLWKGLRFAQTLRDHGDVPEAIRTLSRLRRVSVPPDTLAEIEQLITVEALRQFGLDGLAQNLTDAFDRILQLPRRTFDDVLRHRRWLSMLLPVVDPQRRIYYENLVKKENQLRGYLETLDSASASHQARTEALEHLQKQGIISTQHLYLRVLSQRELQRQQETYQRELLALLKETMARIEDFSPAPHTIPLSFGEEVAAIQQGILAGKTTGLKERHYQLWDQMAHFAPTYEDLVHQQTYFAAQQIANEFKTLWDNELRQGAPEHQRRPNSFTRALDAAKHLHRLATILAPTVYGTRVAAFLEEQRELLDSSIYSLLSFDSRGYSGDIASGLASDQRVRSLLQARSYLAIVAGLQGSRSTALAQADMSALQGLLNHPSLAMRRLALAHMPLDLSEEELIPLLSGPRALVLADGLADAPSVEPGARIANLAPVAFLQSHSVLLIIIILVCILLLIVFATLVL